MIDLYTFTTPNGRKASIMLEEVGLPYQVHKIDIMKGEQFAPEFVAINPNSKIPALVDRDTGVTVFESGAILIYLAEKTGKLLPTEMKQRFAVMEWLMFQMSGVGPMMGQLGYFKRAKEPVPAAIERYTKEVDRIVAVLDKQLSAKEYLAGEYSIADIATYPWVSAMFQMFPTEGHPHLRAWVERVGAREAVKKGMAIPATG